VVVTKSTTKPAAKPTVDSPPIPPKLEACKLPNDLGKSHHSCLCYGSWYLIIAHINSCHSSSLLITQCNVL
jgi:hypothetical protein